MTAGRLSLWRAAMSRSDLHATTKHVAWALSGYMDRDGGSCWPSVGRLAEDTSLHAGTVRHHLRLLEGDGWLSVRPTKGGRHSTNHWQATFP